MEKTLIIVKPDAVHRRLIGRILARFEDKGLQIVALKMIKIERSLAETFYAEHLGKPFYEPLVRFMTSSPCVAAVIYGKNAVTVCRKLMGRTFGPEAEPGTIRGDFSASNRFNVVHGSSSPEDAEREIGLIFKPEEIVEYEIGNETWVYDFSEGGEEPV